MERYKRSETVIKWVGSFLNDRKQKVTVNGAESKNHKGGPPKDPFSKVWLRLAQ